MPKLRRALLSVSHWSIND